jgi:hypothetical protein
VYKVWLHLCRYRTQCKHACVHTRTHTHTHTHTRVTTATTIATHAINTYARRELDEAYEWLCKFRISRKEAELHQVGYVHS